MSIWLLQLLAAGVVVSIVCRAVKMDENTIEPVRWGILCQGGAAFAVAIAPFWVPEWLPWLLVIYMATALFAQMATARFWREGQPQQFRKLTT